MKEKWREMRALRLLMLIRYWNRAGESNQMKTE